MTSAEHTHLVLGTAGHIDHGKSSLVQALTGSDPDRLIEEKQRGITIELGFAQLDLGDGLQMGLVDVPGHERFVRQMIAGASGIDVALFCIAANDGIMPQTIEHKAILELLAIPRCVVALTKCDMVDAEWIEFITEEVRSFLGDSTFADAEIIPVSSHTGEGLDELKQALGTVARMTIRTKQGQAARLPIDRVFTIKGSGTVVTGTLWSGSLAPDDEVEVLPSRIKARIRSVQVHGASVPLALEGNRVALNLNAVKTTEVLPGDFLATPDALTPTDRFDAYFTYFDTTNSRKPLKSGSRVHIAHGTREVVGRILFMGEQELLKSGESAFVQLRTEEALPLTWRDRFIVRSYSPVHVIGGGKVLLCHPRHRTNPQGAEMELLDALNQEQEADICRIAFLMQNHPVTAQEVADFCGLDRASAKKHLQDLHDSGALLPLGEEGRDVYYATKAMRQKYLALIENTLLRFHAEHAQKTGVAKAALMQLCAYRFSSDSFDVLLYEAIKEGVAAFSDGEVYHPQAGVGAKRLEEDTAEQLYQVLSEAGAKPPTVPELIKQAHIDSALAYRAIGLLEKQGRAQRISTELCFTLEALNTLEATLRSYLEQHQAATVSELKEALDSSRKYTVPLLEYFDNQGITVRDGDTRSLR